jgi:hypothetical protein
MAYNPRYEKTPTTPVTNIGSGAIQSENIADGAVKTPDLANDAVTSEKIASNSIKVRHLTEEIFDALQVQSVPDNSIGTEKLMNLAVTAAKLGIGSVSSDKIQASSITSDKLATSSVTKIKLASNSVGYLEIIDGSVTTPKIVNGVVTPIKLSATGSPADTNLPSYDAATGLFKWVAAGGAGGLKMKTGTYAGDNMATQAITGVGFQPKVVIVFSSMSPGAFGLRIKTDKDGLYSGENTGGANAWAYKMDLIISLDADGFTVGQSDLINTSPDVFTYIAFG